MTRMSVRWTYAGIGSRRAPIWALQIAERAASRLAAQGWTLRSGHAPGMDQAFERGAGKAAEVYLPWSTFEADVPLRAEAIIGQPSAEAYTLAAEHHPNWAALAQGGRALQARNSHQILGPDLTSPVAFVLCWTPDGSLDGHGRGAGGTGQALRLASAHAVSTFNLQRPDHLSRVQAFLAAVEACHVAVGGS